MHFFLCHSNQISFLTICTCWANQFLVNSSASSMWKEVPLIIISFPTMKSVGKKNLLLCYTFLYFYLSKNLPLTIPIFIINIINIYITIFYYIYMNIIKFYRYFFDRVHKPLNYHHLRRML